MIILDSPPPTSLSFPSVLFFAQKWREGPCAEGGGCLCPVPLSPAVVSLGEALEGGPLGISLLTAHFLWLSTSTAMWIAPLGFRKAGT